MTVAARSGGGIRAALPLVTAGFVISFVLVGGGINTVSVFVNAIAATTDWSRSQLSLAVSVGALSAALVTPLVGAAVDRFGVRVPMTIGVVLLACGFSVLPVMHAAWQFVAANVLLGAGFGACALLPVTVAVTVCVQERTGLALGLVTAGSSLGALVFAPAAQMIIEVSGWRSTYVFLGGIIVLTPLPFLVFALPRGRLERPTNANAAAGGPTPALHELRRPGVAPLAAIMILPGLASFSVAVHLVPYLTGIGHAASIAAAALGATIGISAVGKIAGGYVADRFGAIQTVRLTMTIWVVAFALLHHASGALALWTFVPLYGLALGTQVAVVPAIALAVLGPERFGTLFGLLQLGNMLASAVGPIVSGLIFDASGQYGAAVLLWIGTMIIATAIAWKMRSPMPLPPPAQAVA